MHAMAVTWVWRWVPMVKLSMASVDCCVPVGPPFRVRIAEDFRADLSDSQNVLGLEK